MRKSKFNNKQLILRTEVRGDFNIHGTNFFHNAVFHFLDFDFLILKEI